MNSSAKNVAEAVAESVVAENGKLSANSKRLEFKKRVKAMLYRKEHARFLQDVGVVDDRTLIEFREKMKSKSQFLVAEEFEDYRQMRIKREGTVAEPRLV